MRGVYSPRLWIVSGMVGLTFLGQTMLAPLTPLFALELGASPLWVGVLVAAAFVLPLFLAMPIGAAIDSWGTRGMLQWGCLLTGLGPMGVAVAPGFFSLTVSQVVIGLGHLMVIVAAQTYVGNLGRGRQGEENFAWYSAFIAGAGLIGPILGGVISDLAGFQIAYAAAGCCSLGAVLLTGLLGPRRGTRSVLGGLALYGRPGQIKRLLDNRPLRVAMVVSCSVLFALGSYGAFLPVYLDSLAVPATLIGVLVSMRSAAALVVRPFMSKIVAVLGGRYGAFLVTTAVVGVGVSLTGSTESLAFLFVVVFLVGAGSGITQPISMVTVTDHVDAQERGFALGLRMTGNRSVQLLSPLLLGVIAEFLGFQAAFLVAGCTLLASMVLIVRWGRAVDGGG